MRTEITSAEIESYQENGFLVVEEFLTRDELDEWRDAFDHAVAERDAPILGHDTDDSDPQLSDAEREERRHLRQVFTQRVNLWQSNEDLRRIMLDPDLGKQAAELAGVEGIRIWHDQALVKQPWANPTSYHLDLPYWSFRSSDAITMWVALDDATVENGCLYYVAGTQKWERYDNVPIGRELGAIFDIYPEWKQLPIVACPVRAGGALFHNGLTCHGAAANMTSGPRRAMTCAYMPDGSTFNGIQNILRPEQLARLSVGDPLDDEDQNPLIYSRAHAARESRR